MAKNDKSWLDEAVLIYGPRKGGTTLLENLHDGNSSLLMHPHETKIKKFLKTHWQTQPQAAKQYAEISTVNMKSFPKFDHQKYKDLLPTLEKANSVFELVQMDMDILHQAAEWKPKNLKKWVIKEVGGDTKSILAAWRMMAPLNSKMVFIVREPLMVVRSIITNRRRKGVRLSLLQLLKETREAINVLLYQLDYIDHTNVHFVTYSQLTGDAEKTMRGICDFIDVEYEEINSKPTIFGESVVVGSSSKASNVVFQSNKQWHDDLTLREKLWLQLCYFVFFRPRKKCSVERMKSIQSFDEVVAEIEARGEVQAYAKAA